MAADDPSRRQLNSPMFDWLRDGSSSVHLRGRGFLSWDDVKLNPSTVHLLFWDFCFPFLLANGSFIYMYIFPLVTDGEVRSGRSVPQLGGTHLSGFLSFRDRRAMLW